MTLEAFVCACALALVVRATEVPSHELRDLFTRPEGGPEIPSHDFRSLGSQPEGGLWTENWRDDIAEVPFYIRSGDFTRYQRKKIIESLADLEERSGVVKFRWWKEGDGDYLFIQESSNGCSSWIGRQGGGYQSVWLEDWCAKSRGNTQHEILHAMGFSHEQNRPDRNDWIKIRWGHIYNNWKSQYYISSSIDSLGCPYDYDSVMHYSAWSNSKTGQKTIKPFYSSAKSLGQRVKASDLDIVQMRLMYQCASGPRNYTLYTAEPCTEDCKCGENMSGCNSDSAKCKGDLICSDDTCTAPERPGGCFDDVEFRYNYIGWKDCDWVGENRPKRCSFTGVSKACPGTCGFC